MERLRKEAQPEDFAAKEAIGESTILRERVPYTYLPSTVGMPSRNGCYQSSKKENRMLRYVSNSKLIGGEAAVQRTTTPAATSLAIIATFFLAACANSGSMRNNAPTDTIGGTVSGLSGTGLVLENNGGDNLAISGNGSFTFSTAVTGGSTYNVTILTQPSNPAQTCTVSKGSGTVNANVTSVQISCANYTIGGTVSGLSGTGLVLENNGGDNLAISGNGSFTFSTAVTGGSTYNVTILTQPSNPAQTCAVSKGSGTVNANVTSVQVSCASFTIGGTVSGLSGTGLVLENNGGDNLAISGNGSFTFSTAVTGGSTYNVTILTQPSNPAQTCAVSKGSGTVNADVMSVQVSCASYTIGGTVSGLSGTLVLENNGGDNLAISGDGGFAVPFTFSTAVTGGSIYNVTVLDQPSNPAQKCTVANGGGTVNTNVTSVEVSCASPFTLFLFDGTDGANPATALVQGTDGNLYGTTVYGGANTGCPYSCGTFFRISTSGELTTLYNFCSQANCTDGWAPSGPLVLGTDGNFYGITEFGGTGSAGCPSPSNCGTAFKVTPNGTLTTIHNWCSEPNCADGNYELLTEPGTFVQGTDGNFYGVNDAGGEAGHGTAFKLTPSGTLTTIHTWCSESNCTDGSIANGLIQATDGNFYGTTYGGGSNNLGTFFKMTPSGAVTTLYNFCSEGGWPVCTDGGWPAGPLVQASTGDFYGTTSYGGANEQSAACAAQGINGGFCGTVFKITARGSLTTLYNFCSQPNCTDGASPGFQPVLASDGNFYGVTLAGGDPSCTTSLPLGPGCGTVFKLTESGVLTTLQVPDSEYQYPEALIQATMGTFYGETVEGAGYGSCSGGLGCGTLFSVATGLPPFVETVPTTGQVGAAVSILGTNLTGATSVTFNGTVAAFEVVSASEIKTAIPAKATTGFIKVVTPSGTLESNVNFAVSP